MKRNSLPASEKAVRPKVMAPLSFIAMAFAMVLNFLPIVSQRGLGSGLSFMGWLLPLAVCGLTVLVGYRRITFPLGLWLPWAIWVTIYVTFASADNALQRSVMMLTPLVVGAAFSSLKVDFALLDKFDLWLDRFFWLFLIAAGVSTGLLIAGQLSAVSGFASGAITASLLAVWYAARYASGNRRALLFWLALAAVPVLGNTRTGIVAVALTLPLTLAPLSMMKRIAALVVFAVAGLMLFQTERVQAKMFYSGQGTLADAVAGFSGMFAGDDAEVSDFATTGRKRINDALLAGFEDAYWLGHGANTTEDISMSMSDVAHPHNDWLRIRYEYGLVGLVILSLTMLAQMRHAWRRARRRRTSAGAILLFAGASAYVPMALFMVSDNMLVYVAWFGNLHFAMLGLGYAAMKALPPDGRQGVRG